jgi:hypothetical protein
MPPRKTRQVAPQPVEDVTDELPEAFAAPVRKPRAAQLRRVQAAAGDEKVRLPQDERAVEVADGELKAPIAGRYFRLSDSIGLMPLMEWAAAREEIDVDNGAQLLGMFRILKDLVDPEDWDEFRAHTREAKCIDEDFVAFQAAAMEAIAARPTAVPATS